MSAVRSETPTGKRRQAVELMVKGHTQEEISRRLGIGRMTLYRWRRRPEFARALAEAEDDAWRAQLRTLARAAEAGTAYLITVMGNAAVPTELRVRAASTLTARWTALQPQRVLADINMATAPLPETDNALAELRQMLDTIGDHRERTSMAAIRGNGRSVVDVAEVASNGRNGNGGPT
jgi:hypothetical protein